MDYGISHLCGLHWGFGLFLTSLLLIDENVFLVLLLRLSAGLISVDIFTSYTHLYLFTRAKECQQKAA